MSDENNSKGKVMSTLEELEARVKELEQSAEDVADLLTRLTVLELRFRNFELEIGKVEVRVAEVDPGPAPLPNWPGAVNLLSSRGLSISVWLAELVDQAGGSPCKVDRMIAVGRLVRLWSPGSAAEREAALRQAKAGEPILAQVGRDALSWLEEGDGDWMEATGHIQCLFESLDENQAPLRSGYVLATRDDLESLRVVLALRSSSGRDGFEYDLKDFDSLCDKHGARALVPSEDTKKWFDAVRCNEPEAWWACTPSERV